MTNVPRVVLRDGDGDLLEWPNQPRAGRGPVGRGGRGAQARGQAARSPRRPDKGRTNTDSLNVDGSINYKRNDGVPQMTPETDDLYDYNTRHQSAASEMTSGQRASTNQSTAHGERTVTLGSLDKVSYGYLRPSPSPCNCSTLWMTDSDVRAPGQVSQISKRYDKSQATGDRSRNAARCPHASLAVHHFAEESEVRQRLLCPVR